MPPLPLSPWAPRELFLSYLIFSLKMSCSLFKRFALSPPRELICSTFPSSRLFDEESHTLHPIHPQESTYLPEVHSQSLIAFLSFHRWRFLGPPLRRRSPRFRKSPRKSHRDRPVFPVTFPLPLCELLFRAFLWGEAFLLSPVPPHPSLPRLGLS